MVTDKLLHAHVFRTGGFLLRGVLQRIPGLRVLDTQLHPSVDTMLAVCAANRLEPPPVVAFVRNPWEWYVSQWCWVCAAKPGYRSSFRSYMEAIRECSTTDPNITTLSHHYYAYIQAQRAQYVGRFEHLREDITCILMQVMPDVMNADQIRELMETEPVHHPSIIWPTTQRMEHYSRYYGLQTRLWVEKWDAGLIAQFGYVYEDLPGPSQ